MSDKVKKDATASDVEAIVKWLTLDSIDGERTIKQHGFTGKTKTDFYTGKYEGNISLCGKVVASREGPREMNIAEIHEISEPLDENNVCKTCLKKAT